VIDRFIGVSGRRLLVDTLKNQKLVTGTAELAERIADLGELIEVKPGDRIIEQGNFDNSIYLIVAGSFEIVVNGRAVAARFPNDHVGEMAAITPYLPRSATVVANQLSVVLRLSEPQFAGVGAEHPEMWRCIAKELSHRLMQRNALVARARTQTRVFVVSSVEAIEIARAVQSAFQYDPFTVTVWENGIFRASQYPIESLSAALDQSDFAIAVVQPDDKVECRGTSFLAPRDNVVFELGFFMGRLGRHRTFLLEPRGKNDEAKLPTDLTGINTVRYEYCEGRDLAAKLAPACNHIRQIVNELGPDN